MSLMTIEAEDLLERLVARTPTALLDVRRERSDGIEAPASARHVPAAEALASAGDLARELPAETVVVCSRGITAQPVAAALRSAGLDARVLAGGLRAWLGVLRAVPVDTGIAELVLEQVQRPGRGCLSYLLAAGGEAIVVDPAADAGFYVERAARLGARIVAVVDTHLHADHLSVARELARRSGAALRLPQATLERGFAGTDAVSPLADGDRLELGGVELRAIALPGHTTDMTGLLAGGRALLSGDSLFADGIARPDLQHGDPGSARAMARLLHATLHTRVLALGDDVVLLPGHDHPGVREGAVASTLGEVRARVPELVIDDPEAFATEVLAGMPPRPANYTAIIAANAGYGPADPDLERGGNSCATR